MDITTEFIRNPDFLSQYDIDCAERALKKNTRGFNDLTPPQQRLFNYILETEPKRCFCGGKANWLQVIPSGPVHENDRSVVRLDVPEEPAFIDEPIFIDTSGYYQTKAQREPHDEDHALSYLASTAVSHSRFIGYIAPNGTISGVWHGDINETWKARYKNVKAS